VGELAAFLGIAALVIVTPGQDTALTIRNTLLGGRRAGVFTALGVSAGQAVWTMAAAAGVTAVVLASERAFEVLRLAGAAYLVVLGAQALLGALRGVPTRAAAHEERRRALAAGRAFRQGLLSNLANPKMAVFFTSLLPQFASAFTPMLALGLVFCGLTLAWLSAYAHAVARAGDVLRRPRVRRTLEAVTGAILVALGLRVATSDR
jgi:threonine/homoserine/homoserine lactone efflux protein